MFLIIRVVLLSRSQHKAHKVLLAAGLADARRLMVIFSHGRAGRAIHIKIAQKQWQTYCLFNVSGIWQFDTFIRVPLVFFASSRISCACTAISVTKGRLKTMDTNALIANIMEVSTWKK